MNRRGSGILLHITSLPSPYGVGDLGPSAYRFIDFLSEAKQSYWQILPLNATGRRIASPYNGSSVFAGNILFISPEKMVDDGYLEPGDIEDRLIKSGGKVDYPSVYRDKAAILKKAYIRFTKRPKRDKQEFYQFNEEHSSWLGDYTLFTALKSHFKGIAWREWPADLRRRRIRAIVEIKRSLSKKIEMEQFLQYLFFQQWRTLHDYCQKKGVQIIGDMPLYLDMESADVWSHQDIFKLDSSGGPQAVAGVPPDDFSSTGQLWGNPVYRWDVLKQRGYDWWFDRIIHLLRLVDFIRMDHFRGLVAYWEVPAGQRTALNGKWVEAPAVDFLDKLYKKLTHLPIIAEDLGLITADVQDVMKRFYLTGMKILMFAFGDDCAVNPYAPHNFIRNSIVYTGTHDNNTVKGWFDFELDRKGRRRLSQYLGKRMSRDRVSWELIRLASMSIADTSIFPMQDILALGADARMNRPATVKGNWQWRMLPEQLTDDISRRLRNLTEAYGRA